MTPIIDRRGSNEATIAVIQADIGYIKDDIKAIKQGIKELSGVYVTKQEFDDELRAFKLRVEAQEKNANLWRLLTPIVSGVLCSVVTFLVIFYLQNIKV